MGYIFDFRIDSPPYKKSQQDAFQWLAEEYSRHNPETPRERYLALLSKVGAKPTQVESRSHYLPDFASVDSKRLLFKEEKTPVLQDRMAFFDEASLGIFSRLFRERPPFYELLHVTCTGYISPSAAQKWVLGSQHKQNITVTHLYHMGCYASLPAIRLARFLSLENKRIEICHTELCTLHLNPREPSLEDFVTQTLFADGACAYTVQKDRPKAPSFKIIKSYEELLGDSHTAMTWGLHEAGFKMTLSRDVPGLVKKALPDLLGRALGDNFNLADPSTIWAIHPGGPKIVEEIQTQFNLSSEQVHYSQRILKTRGNMSSATLPHIWNEILNDDKVKSGTQVLTMAFGPGLTVSLAQLEVVK